MRLTVAAMFMLLGLMPIMAWAQTDMAVVNVDRVMTMTKAAKNIEDQVKSKREQYQKEFSKHERDLRVEQEKLIDNRGKLEEAEFNKKRQDFEKKLSETQKLFQKRRDNLAKAFAVGTAQLQKKMFQVVADIAEEKGYRVIFDRKSVVIVEEDLDITADVIKKIDKDLPDIRLDIKE